MRGLGTDEVGKMGVSAICRTEDGLGPFVGESCEVRNAAQQCPDELEAVGTYL